MFVYRNLLWICGFILYILATFCCGKKQLTGRFMHITDFHPDQFYGFDAPEKYACHSHPRYSSKSLIDDEPNNPDIQSKSSAKAGYWGLPLSRCDTSMTFVNSTFDWLSDNWKDELDFVIWTGDSARHDLDSTHPRTLDEIIESNEHMAKKMKKSMGNVPVIPSIGNNDIWPHNVMWAGPNKITSRLAHAWRDFIPEDQYHTFAEGGYYSHEVIPGSLVVVALNTQYFFDSNKVVDGCPRPKKSQPLEPGTEELVWLESQLSYWRKKGLQVWLSGHVPPAPGRWYEDCYEWYGELALSFQDTILGHLFGHMNIDHFFWFDAEHVLHEKISEKGETNSLSEFAVAIDSDNDNDNDNDNDKCLNGAPNILQAGDKSDMVNDLKGYYKHIGNIQNLKPKDFATVHVTPSIIPKYLPGVRVWTYNISEADRYVPSSQVTLLDEEDEDDDDDDEEDEENDDAESEVEEDEEGTNYDKEEEDTNNDNLMLFDQDLTNSSGPMCNLANVSHSIDMYKKKKKNKKHKRRKGKKGKRKDRIPRHYSRNSPSRSNKYLTPLMYAQFYVDMAAANLNQGWGPKHKIPEINRPPPSWDLAYVTGKPSQLKQLLNITTSPAANSSLPTPFPQQILKSLRQSITNETDFKSLTPYRVKDLTIKSWLKMASRVTQNKSSWKAYVRRMFVMSKAEDDW